MVGLRLDEGMVPVAVTAECLGAQTPSAEGKMRPVPVADLYPQMGLEPYYPVRVASCGAGVGDEGMGSLVEVRRSGADVHPAVAAATVGAQEQGISGASHTGEHVAVQATGNAKPGPEGRTH